MTKYQYCVERDSPNPWEKIKPVFFKDGREAIKYARSMKDFFPFHRVRVTLYCEVK